MASLKCAPITNESNYQLPITNYQLRYLIATLVDNWLRLDPHSAIADNKID